eukprot:gene9176-biopygen15036
MDLWFNPLGRPKPCLIEVPSVETMGPLLVCPALPMTYHTYNQQVEHFARTRLKIFRGWQDHLE